MHGQVTRSPQSGAAVGLTSGARTSPQEIGFAAHEAGDSSIAGSLSPSSNRSSIGLPTKPIPISRGRGNLAEDGAFSQGYPSHAQSLPPQAPVIGSLPYPSGLASPPPFELAPSSPDTSTLQVSRIVGMVSVKGQKSLILIVDGFCCQVFVCLNRFAL